MRGHYWTIAPTLAHRVRPGRAPASEPWSTTIDDPDLGPVTLRGQLRDLPGADTCLVVIHGLGGSPDAFYCVRAARLAEAAGLSCLRLSLRGADRQGEDFYHAGLTADLEAAVASAALSRYRHIHVLGYSLGGHMALRYALSPSDERVVAVGAISPPLDLDRGAVAIDRRGASIYRRHVLAGLNEIYAEVAARRPVPTPLQQVRAARTIREWDSLAVVPRHGFDDVEHYYASMSVGPHLSELALRARIVHSTHDPMIPPWTYEDHIARTGAAVDVELLRSGGHVAFPERDEVELRMVAWMLGE
ncbi:MAG: alpha/beta fold hydrolase [Myxococcales bacterium]|jgi:predicted alpha/beta-fold hydrolase